MLAVRQGSEPDKAKKVVDFLLAKSVSPAETDHIKGCLDSLFRCVKILTRDCFKLECLSLDLPPEFRCSV